MRGTEANIFVFIASVIIGILISMNISIYKGKTMDTVFMSAKQYQDAYTYKNQLYNDILSLIAQYNDNYDKLKKYMDNEENETQITNTIKEELNKYDILLGKVPIEGQGISIYLNDASMGDGLDIFEYQMKIIHNTDIIQVVNDLKNAGSEAVSINGHRIIDNSEIYCSGPFLRVNGVKIAAPFLINAIGNKDVLYEYMMSNENYLKTMMIRKININVKKYDNIQIPAYSGERKIYFMSKEK